MKRHIWIPIVLGVAAAAITAAADPVPTAPPPAPEKLEGHSTASFRAKPLGVVAPSLFDLNRLPGRVLTDFSLRFDEGDRSLKELGIGLYSDSVSVEGTYGPNFSITETAKDDFYRWRVSWYRLNEVPLLNYKGGSGRVASCPGECRIPINARPAGSRFVLTGFTFKRPSMAHVRRVTVLPYPDQRYVLVRFQDNGSPAFDAKVSYAYVPDQYFKATRQDQRFEFTPGGPPTERIIGYHRLALVGFDFEFRNGAHPLGYFGIIYNRPNFGVRFFDRNRDDPWRAEVRYELLK